MTEQPDQVSRDLARLGRVPGLSDERRAALRAEMLASLSSPGDRVATIGPAHKTGSTRSSWLLAAAAVVLVLGTVVSMSLLTRDGQTAVQTEFIAEPENVPVLPLPTSADERSAEESVTQVPEQVSTEPELAEPELAEPEQSEPEAWSGSANTGSAVAPGLSMTEGQPGECPGPSSPEGTAAPVAVDLDGDGLDEYIVEKASTSGSDGSAVVDYSVITLSPTDCALSDFRILRSGVAQRIDDSPVAYEWLCAHRTGTTTGAAVELVQIATSDSFAGHQITVFDMVGGEPRARPPAIVDGALPATAIKLQDRTGAASCVADGLVAYTSVQASQCAGPDWDVLVPAGWHTMVVGDWACKTFSPWPMQWPCQCDAGHVVELSWVDQSFDEAVQSVLTDRGLQQVPVVTSAGTRLTFGEQLNVDRRPTGSPEDHVRTYVVEIGRLRTAIVTLNYATSWAEGQSGQQPVSYDQMIQGTEAIVRSFGPRSAFPAAYLDRLTGRTAGDVLVVGEPVCVAGVPDDDPLNIRSGPGTTSAVLDVVGNDSCALRVLDDATNGWVPVRVVRMIDGLVLEIDGWVSNRFVFPAAQHDSPEAAFVSAFDDVLIMHEPSSPQCEQTEPGEVSCSSLAQWSWVATGPCNADPPRWKSYFSFSAPIAQVDGRWTAGERRLGLAVSC